MIAILTAAMLSATLAATVQSAHASDGNPVCSPRNPHVCADSALSTATTKKNQAAGGGPSHSIINSNTVATTSGCPPSGPGVFKNGKQTCAG